MCQASLGREHVRHATLLLNYDVATVIVVGTCILHENVVVE